MLKRDYSYWDRAIGGAKLFVLFAICMASVACASISYQERLVLTELESHNVSPTSHKVKEPAVAALLNILPGIGNFYLGGEDGGQFFYGVLNLLTWPISPVWAIPQGAVDADTINRRATARYYLYGPGQKRLAEIRGEYYEPSLPVQQAAPAFKATTTYPSAAPAPGQPSASPAPRPVSETPEQMEARLRREIRDDMEKEARIRELEAKIQELQSSSGSK